MKAYEAYTKALHAKKRMPELEFIILQDAECAYWYARDVIDDRWPEAELVIMQDAMYAHWYAVDVIKGRWPEAEPVIMHDAYYAYAYAYTILKKRWPEAEPVILQHVPDAFRYVRDVIKGRWLEAEETIAKSVYKNIYAQVYLSDEPVITKDKVDINLWQRKNAQGYFAPTSLFKVSLLDMMVEK